MTPAQAYTALLTTEDHFLGQCFIQIAGDSPSGVVPYVIGYTAGKVPPPPPAPLLETLRFKVDPAASATSDAAGRHPFPSHCVEMVNYDTLVGHGGPGIGAINAYTLPAAGGADPDIMVTGQLSGCTFCVLQVGATVLCAHIQPPAHLPVGVPAGVTPGSWLQTQLATHGRFAGHAVSPLTCFGSNSFFGAANIVGIRRAGQWRIYAQVNTGPGHITGVTRII